MKKYFLASVAVIVAITLSSFTQQRKVVEDGELWYHFIGNANDPDDVTDPLMYVLDEDGSEPTFCEATSGYRCEILNAPQTNPAHPDLDEPPVLITKRVSPTE